MFDEAVYAATKFALEGLAESWSYELNGEGIRTTIVQPGAFGTSFGEKMMQPREADRLESYGPAQGMFASMAESFSSGEFADPQLVVDTLVELAESTESSGSLRIPVGEDAKMACTPINEAQARAQAALMSFWGWD